MEKEKGNGKRKRADLRFACTSQKVIYGKVELLEKSGKREKKKIRLQTTIIIILKTM
jgi:hypothetical protein